MEVRAPRGTVDIYGNMAALWGFLSETAESLFSAYGYEPIHTPLFERTEVFTRGIGEATDVVNKEMYDVVKSSVAGKIRDGEPLGEDDERSLRTSLTLRPEATASVVRAVIEHNLVPQGAVPAKLFYTGPMFRYERPQKGRQRQFWQIGVEALGASGASLDAEMIIMMMRYFGAIGIPADRMKLLVNSMGDDACRPAYREKIREYIHTHEDELCEDCVARAQTNPLRAFDCKKPACADIMSRAPKLTDSLCEECAGHYRTVLDLLGSAGIEYEEDPTLVRGLDYYTRTVFEVQVDGGLGAQNAIGGGGRYDKLVETVGGRPTPGIGFALGFERMALALQGADVEFEKQFDALVYVAAVDDTVRDTAFGIAQALRDEGVPTEIDHQSRSLKSQFKAAGSMRAPFVVIIGPDEVARDEAVIRDMETKNERTVPLDLVVITATEMIDAWLFSKEEQERDTDV